MNHHDKSIGQLASARLHVRCTFAETYLGLLKRASFSKILLKLILLKLIYEAQKRSGMHWQWNPGHQVNKDDNTKTALWRVSRYDHHILPEEPISLSFWRSISWVRLVSVSSTGSSRSRIGLSLHIQKQLAKDIEDASSIKRALWGMISLSVNYSAR
jgi:hypothetical protein